MGRGNNSANKRAREADRERKRQDKKERARQRRADSPGGIEIASVGDIQTAAVNATVAGIDANGHVLTGDEHERGASGPPCRLFVGGLSRDTTADELRTLFSEVGDVIDAVIVADRDTGDSRGFGFVTMADRKSASKAMRQLSGHEIDGRPIRIDSATERP
jgi:hypothetical protein